MIDENEFYRNASSRILGNLQIEKALWDCLMYIRDYIPADMIFMNAYDPGTGINETLAQADLQGSRLVSLKFTVSPETRFLLKELPRIGNSSILIVADRVGKHPILGPMATIEENTDAPFMSIGPMPEWKLGCGIFIGNHEGKKYSDYDARLFALLNEPFGIAFLNYMRYREIVRLKDILADDHIRYLQDDLHHRTSEEIVGANFGLKQAMEMVRQVAPRTSPVLLLGETGTGKEVIATAIHNLSPRRNGPFIKVNCGAIPDSLMDSELFGHDKGAFTGALFQKRGRFERADGGTIFLDEIGELTPEAQIRLLRVIQEREIERVGGTEVLPVDIRVIAATHRNLEAMMAKGKFREDLYFRLNVFPVFVPPLRERSADIPALVQHFMIKNSREMGLPEVPTLAIGAIDKLINYSWPGNVRELQNAVERAIILSRGNPLRFEDLGEPGNRVFPVIPRVTSPDIQGLDQTIVKHINRALRMTGGCVGGKQGAAKLLGMNPSTLRGKMRKLGIPFGRKTAKP